MDALRNTARRSGPLLNILSQTECAPSGLEVMKRHIRDLDSELQHTQNSIRALRNDQRREYMKYERHHASVIERWIYKVTGNEAKFAAKVKREGDRYAQILEKLQQANAIKHELEEMRIRALSARVQLREDCTRREEAQREFNALYASLFRGPSSPSPEVDVAERNVESALRAYEESYLKLKKDQEVERILKEATLSIRSTLTFLDEALCDLRSIFVRCMLADRMKQFALLNAILAIEKAQKDISRAQQFSTEVQGLPRIDVSLGLEMGFTQIKSFRDQVEQYKQAVWAQLTEARERLRISKQQAASSYTLLDYAKNELQKERQNVIRTLAADDSWEEPPPYSSDNYPLLELEEEN
ncbi:hypothetical protein F5Y12DRAFT_709121 [Xylaria sp. FL1777]|nr:hypothetical protein F5Y12DRAFT_709121 [Xylaria sp. FL1777]